MENKKKINHVGIIMDGNRRFSKRLMLKPWQGHEHGAKKVKEILNWCKEYDIRNITLYAFSYENFNRPKEEFNFLMKLFLKEFDDLIANPEDLEKDKIKIKFIGRIDKFPDDVRQRMDKLMDMTKDYDNYIVNFAMAYSGRIELVDAVKKMIEKGMKADEVDEKSIMDHLYLNSEPEIIIRTGGERRMSNFLTFQSVYSELFFTDKLWPEFAKEDFEAIIDEFNNRDRRFGK